MSASRLAALGIFCVGGLLLFALGLFWIGDRRQLFGDNVGLSAEFHNVSGISPGALVRISGLDAGEVLEVEIPVAPQAPFRVHFRTAARFLPVLRTDSVVSIQTDGIVGNKFLQVEAGTDAAAAVGDGTTLPSREPIELSDLLAQATGAIATANEAIGDIRVGIDQTVHAVLELNEQTIGTVRTVGNQVNRFAENANGVSDDVRAIVSNVRSGRGAVGRLLNDDTIYDDLRVMATEGQQVTRNLKDVSGDLAAISDDLKARDLGGKIEQVTDGIKTLTQEAVGAVRSFQGADGASGNLLATMRQTLNNANEAMANLAEDSEALKRNWFFRGFFNQRGFFDLDAVGVREYQEGRFLSDRQKVSEWIDGAVLFATNGEGRDYLTDDGKRRLNLAMSRFLLYSKNEPFIIESWAGAGSDPETILKSRERAILVSEYLVDTFELKSNYVATMPMNAGIPQGAVRDGVGLVLYAPKPRK